MRATAMPAATLSTSAPALSRDELAALATRLYGIEGGMQALASERDQNCRITALDGRSYVFKIGNPSEPVELVDFQIAALEHIKQAAPALPVPRVIRTVDGRTRASVDLGGGVRASVRMLSYVDGVQAKEAPRSVEQRLAMGSLLGRLDLALQGFDHPAARHDLPWNVCAAHRLAGMLDGVADGPHRALAQLFMQRFINDVLPRLGALRAQVIHNDYHFYNVLVDPTAPARITGIIDFGDMLHAPLVGEVSTAAAFHMTGNADPFEGAAQFIGAYHAALPLNEAEQEVLPGLIATRHLITALITDWRARRYPANRTYILRHNPAAWEALSQLADVPAGQARARFLSAIR